jgi:hypothetical protein
VEQLADEWRAAGLFTEAERTTVVERAAEAEGELQP